MTRTTTLAALLTALILGCPATASAQTAPTFEKKNYNYSEWAKGRERCEGISIGLTIHCGVIARRDRAIQ
jgi:hypothetical protein